MKKNSFLKNVTILISSQVIIKIIGIIYKLYLTNKTGFADTGNAIFSAAFQVYAIFLTLCSIGVPNAISSLISARFAVGDNNGAYRIFKIAIAIFGTIGFIGSTILYSLADTIANLYLQMPETKLVLKALAPSIFVTAISSVLKGYFNGKERMEIPAKSLSIEQISKTALAIIIVEILSDISNNNTIIMVCGVGITTTIASIINCFYMYRNYLKGRKEIWTDVLTSKIYKKERKIHIIKNIFKVAMPITICTIIASFNKTIDAFTIVRITKRYLGEKEAIKQYGILSGKIESLIALPFSFNMAIVTTLIPRVSGDKAKGDLNKTKEMIKSTILAGILFTIPYLLVVYTFPEQILKILFPNASDGATMLKLSSIGIIIAIVMQTISGYLQGINKMKVQMIAIGISSIIKLLLNIILLPNSNIGIYGAIISNIISTSVATVILIVYLIMNEKITFELKKFILKPAILIITTYIIMASIYKMKIVSAEIFRICMSSAIATSMYVVMIMILNAFPREKIKKIKLEKVDIKT